VLLLCGIVIGAHVLGVFSVNPSVAHFFADLGNLLLMFFAGLDIDFALFRHARDRSYFLGIEYAVPSVDWVVSRHGSRDIAGQSNKDKARLLESTTRLTNRKTSLGEAL
jgi:hypothetical protein